MSHRGSSRLARVIPSMHGHLCVVWWLFSSPVSFSSPFRCSSSRPSRCLPPSSTRSSCPKTCATSAWGPWPVMTTRHPSHVLCNKELIGRAIVFMVIFVASSCVSVVVCLALEPHKGSRCPGGQFFCSFPVLWDVSWHAGCSPGVFRMPAVVYGGRRMQSQIAGSSRMSVTLNVLFFWRFGFDCDRVRVREDVLFSIRGMCHTLILRATRWKILLKGDVDDDEDRTFMVWVSTERWDQSPHLVCSPGRWTRRVHKMARWFGMCCVVRGLMQLYWEGHGCQVLMELCWEGHGCQFLS